MIQYFYRTPFAASGDISPIPIGPLGDGSLSYAEGFSFDYERNPATDPAAKRIPRDQTNQLYRDITDNIGQYQRFSVPEWITSADNGGTPYAYARGAQVRYDAGAGVRVFASLVDANTSVPGSDATKWRDVDPFSTSLIALAADYVTPSSNALLVSPGRLATAVREGRLLYAAATRVGAAYALPLPGATFAQGAGATVEFSVPDASPAGPLTLKVNALATIPLQTAVETNLAAGDLQPNRVYTARSNGSAWLILNPLPSQLSPPVVIPDRLSDTTGANLADLNAATANGWYKAAAGVTNGPAALAAVALFVEVHAVDANNLTQVARAVTGQSEANTRTYQRTRIAGTWGPWFRLLQTATEQQQNSVQPGMVGFTASPNAPNGWLIRDGSAVSRATYADLFAVIGIMYGPGDGATTFNIPNAQIGNGLFDRAGDVSGVYYPDQVGEHAHSVQPPSVSSEGGSGYTVSGAVGAETITPYSTAIHNPGGQTVPPHMRYTPIIKY